MAGDQKLPGDKKQRPREPGKRFVLLHVASEMSSSVFPLTEKKSENPAASPGEKRGGGGRGAGGVAQP